MAFFCTGQEHLFLALSEDADDPARVPRFEDVGRGEPVYVAPSGSIRDPALSPTRMPDGFWYLAHTRLPSAGTHYNTATGPALGFLRSPDLRTWHPVGTGVLEVGLPALTHAWAPKWFIENDGSACIVFSGATAPDSAPTPFEFFVIRPLTSELGAGWGPARPLTGTFPPDRLDALVVRQDDGTLACVFKNRVTHTLELAVAPALEGPYSAAAAWTQWGRQEGPALLRLRDGRWRLFFDWPDNAPGNYRFADSSGVDLATARWTGPRGTWGHVHSDRPLRHGSLVRVDADDARRLRSLRG